MSTVHDLAEEIKINNSVGIGAFYKLKLRLSPECRLARFGHPASDAFLMCYAIETGSRGVALIGAFANGTLQAVVELSQLPAAGPKAAAAAFSVATEHQDAGFGSLLMSRLVMFSAVSGVEHLVVGFGTSNHRMQRIVEKHGARLSFADGECVAVLEFSADPDITYRPAPRVDCRIVA